MDRAMIRRVLVANRGEIAIRIARSCREMGIESVLASSEDELSSFAAGYFDDVVSLGEGDSRETYLNVSRVIDAARAAGADAIHPGYGFLSERAALASACEDAGIVFIGPGADVIELMGSKSASRQLMTRLGVPVVPGYDGEEQGQDRMTEEAGKIGFPLLVKASAGGGGKGMRVVRDPGGLVEALDAARREAGKSFGNDRLLMERYIEQPRHVEFQVFGDRQGSVVHLFERDCSIQRRHQKVVEETPAPLFSPELRQKMSEAALAAARGVGYTNAGTVEFILAPGGEFYFLEMNTRLQVEHPITESVTGTDLVRAQIRVAEGQPLPWRQEEIFQRGHAVECRIYAEDAENDFLPQTGTITTYREPSGPGIRVDAGVMRGSEITIRYDPMLAKLVAWAESRDAAIDRLVRGLREFVVLGVTTNLSYLRRVVDHEAFREGKVHTGFLGEHREALRKERPDELAAIAAVLAGVIPAARSPHVSSSLPSVWDSLGGWSP
ncbi:MAG TPA: biotin carboxylase N-terminal domain-containing protein [Thermoanaerobaculia bacterium]|nr:biotin carboxylase N-terminal domain-containing protein [Thermoanaerobaculia bacterium]